MQFYDMHSHILPEFDDGAKSVQEALDLISVLKKQGVNNICLTPHFYTHEMSLEDFVKSRNEAFEKFKPYIPEDVNIVLGTEVYITRYIFGNDDLSELSYGNSRYILTEFGYNSSFSENTMNRFYSFINDYDLIPVIPHVERYQTLMENPSIIEELKDIGVVIQTNITNYTKKASMFRRRKLLNLISKGLIDIIGSDAHSLSHNTPEVYREAINCISSKCGRQVVAEMMEKSKEIFENAV